MELKHARIITTDEMHREKRCVVHYNTVSRLALERAEVQRLLDDSKIHGVPEYEFGDVPGKYRRKLGSYYEDD